MDTSVKGLFMECGEMLFLKLENSRRENILACLL